jgi:lipocalin
VGSSATYILRDDGKVDVLNQCYKGKLEGEPVKAHGIGMGCGYCNEREAQGLIFLAFFRSLLGH